MKVAQVVQEVEDSDLGAELLLIVVDLLPGQGDDVFLKTDLDVQLLGGQVWHLAVAYSVK